MKTITATEAKNRLGAVMDSALVEPIMIEKSGRNSVVIIAVAEYERQSGHGRTSDCVSF